ncbi:MAG: PAS domain-containing protein [Candidatus Micrarchaeota archaeon]|nr:PAS domain-containing protein [Candidatus Micrarchaeota archaeon]
MADQSISGKSLLELMEMEKRSPSISDLVSKAALKLKEMSNADSVAVKDMALEGIKASQSEEFAVNTGKPYIDNRLSGYSAFPDLIAYYNQGFKSCMTLPIASDSRTFGIITLLSKSENLFSEQLSGMLDIIAKLASAQASVKFEREKSLNVAKYFDAAFGNRFPQFLADRKGRLVKANKMGLNLIDRTANEIAGSSIRDFFRISDDELAKLSNGMQIDAADSKGASRRFVISSSIVNEKLMHLLLEDSTDAGIADDRNMLLNSSNDAFLMLDKSARIEWASQSTDRVFGLNSMAVTGRKISEIIANGDDIAAKISNLGDSIYSADIKISVGNDFYTDATLQIYRNANGYSCVLSKDYKKYVEQANRSVKDVIELSSDAVIITDESGYIKSTNKNADKLLRNSSSELNGTNIASLGVEAEDQEKISNSIILAKKSSSLTDIFVNVRPSGSDARIPVSQSIKALTDDAGRTSGYIFISRDLSPKMMIEELKENIERISKDAEKYKEESDLKTQFIYNISHDLKTPITNIKGFSILLLNGEFGQLNDDQKSYTKLIIDELDRLMRLIQQMLDVAKLSSGKVKLDLQQVNFNELKENPSIKAIAEMCEKSGLEFSWVNDYNVPEITADPNRLIQVFVNLIGNALKFTEKGFIRVHVSRKGKNVRVEVQDSGIGISKEDKQKVFKKFYQLQRKGMTMQEKSGTGLGLSIVKGIVKLHYGSVGLKSEVGKGSTFYFTLPVSRKAKEEARKQ